MEICLHLQASEMLSVVNLQTDRLRGTVWTAPMEINAKLMGGLQAAGSKDPGYNFLSITYLILLYWKVVSR